MSDKIKALDIKLLEEREMVNSAATRLRICDEFGTGTYRERPLPNDLEKILKAYRDERENIFKDHITASKAITEIETQIRKLNREHTKIAKERVKQQEKVKKEKAKLKEKRLRKKAEDRKEKERIKAERVSFWPKKVYCVTITLEQQSTMTPASSRRSSTTTISDEEPVVNISSTTFHEPSKVMDGEIHLSLSYITYSASWSSRYDLSLDTVSPLSHCSIFLFRYPINIAIQYDLQDNFVLRYMKNFLYYNLLLEVFDFLFRKAKLKALFHFPPTQAKFHYRTTILT
jgi:hypothetical protein